MKTYSVEEIIKMTPKEREEALVILEEQDAILNEIIKKQWKVVRWPFLFIGLAILCAIIFNEYPELLEVVK